MAPSTVYAAHDGVGAYRTTDGGLTWALFNQGLTSRLVVAFGAALAPKSLVYASTGDGIFKYVNG